MKKHAFYLLLFCLGCHYKQVSKAGSWPPKKITIEDVKKSLCNQPVWEGDTIHCPDSIHVEPLKMKDTSLYIFQCFYGVGDENATMFRLIDLQPDTFYILDEILNYRQGYQPDINITYNDSFDWFTYIDEGSGTNHYSLTKQIVRVHEKKFLKLFSFPQYVSDIDPEQEPMFCQSVETTELSMSREKIMLSAIYEEGVITPDDQVKKMKVWKDRPVFLYTDSCKCFILSEHTDPRFTKFWKEGINYPGD